MLSSYLTGCLSRFSQKLYVNKGMLIYAFYSFATEVDPFWHGTRFGTLHNLSSGIIFILFYFFASLLLWLKREKNNAWYIHLTSHQPPPNLHNLTAAWPVMLLANKRLPYGNQILARIMSLLKSILGKRKFLSTSMFRWRFLRKNFNVLFFWWNTASWSCFTFI